MPFFPNQRIEMVSMTDDPNPIPKGTKGTVTGSNVVNFDGSPFTQYYVDWDNGSSLMPCVPPDTLRLVDPAEDKVTA
jgi:hypothetical protein